MEDLPLVLPLRYGENWISTRLKWSRVIVKLGAHKRPNGSDWGSLTGSTHLHISLRGRATYIFDRLVT